jgi:hypothetical protein
VRKVSENLQINTSKDKLSNNRIRSHGHVLRTNKERITKKVLNMTKLKCPRGTKIKMGRTD